MRNTWFAPRTQKCVFVNYARRFLRLSILSKLYHDTPCNAHVRVVLQASCSPSSAAVAKSMSLLSTVVAVAPLGLTFDDKTKLLFVHIPKNAGSSIELAMDNVMKIRDGPAYHERTYDARKVICPACAPPAIDGKVYPDSIKAMIARYQSSKCQMALGSTSAGYLTGNPEHNSEFVAHTTLRRCRNYTGGIRSFAVVRNPLDRLISGYNWALANGELNHSTFMEFADKSRMHLFKRPQSEFITACTTVFAYERMDDVWDFLISHYPNMKRGEKVNTAKRSTFKPHPDAVSTIMTEYRDDWELWLNAVAHSNSKQWWHNPPCDVPTTLTESGLKTIVETAWRTLSHGQKDEMFRGERPTGPPRAAVIKSSGSSTGHAHEPAKGPAPRTAAAHLSAEGQSPSVRLVHAPVGGGTQRTGTAHAPAARPRAPSTGPVRAPVGGPAPEARNGSAPVKGPGR